MSDTDSAHRESINLATRKKIPLIGIDKLISNKLPSSKYQEACEKYDARFYFYGLHSLNFKRPLTSVDIVSHERSPNNEGILARKNTVSG